MPSLLFEGNSENLKIGIADTEQKTVNIAMYNAFTDSQHSYLEMNLSISELILLKDWIYEQVRAFDK